MDKLKQTRFQLTFNVTLKVIDNAPISIEILLISNKDLPWIFHILDQTGKHWKYWCCWWHSHTHTWLNLEHHLQISGIEKLLTSYSKPFFIFYGKCLGVQVVKIDGDKMDQIFHFKLRPFLHSNQPTAWNLLFKSKRRGGCYKHPAYMKPYLDKNAFWMVKPRILLGFSLP